MLRWMVDHLGPCAIASLPWALIAPRATGLDAASFKKRRPRNAAPSLGRKRPHGPPRKKPAVAREPVRQSDNFACDLIGACPQAMHAADHGTPQHPRRSQFGMINATSAAKGNADGRHIHSAIDLNLIRVIKFDFGLFRICGHENQYALNISWVVCSLTSCSTPELGSGTGMGPLSGRGPDACFSATIGARASEMAF